MSTILTLHDPQTARVYYDQGLWRQDTLYSLLRDHAASRPGAFALRDAVERLSWSELHGWVDSVAEDLHQAGMKRGQRVSVWLPSRAEAIVILLACSRNGYVCNPSLHQNYTTGEVLQLLARIESSALVAQEGYGADATRHDVFGRAQALAGMRRVYRLAPRGHSVAGGGSAFPPQRPARSSSLAPDLNPDKVTYLAFTSGTTGAPKGVMHSDNTLLANGRAMVRDWGHSADSVLLSLSPTSHHIANVGLAQALVAGFEMVLNDRPAGLDVIDWIAASGATYVMGVPTHAIDTLAQMRRRGHATLGRVKVFYMAGATIPRDLAASFLAIGIKPQNVYGMTENGSHQYTLPGDDADTIVSTCGRACSGYEIRLWRSDDPDVEVAAGEIGEIGGRGALLTLGYFGNQHATEASFNALGWFMSGDLGRFDERGNLQVVGRMKDLIIRGGHNIYPARIEDLAHRHAGVSKAVAFPVADERLGERVCLAVIPRTPPGPGAEEMLAHLDAAGLSKYDMPEYYLVMTEFPMTASGKTLKRELVAWARESRIQPTPCRYGGADRPVTKT
ncbi:MAG: acyl--CoA ligase [Burkholderiales bacterium]|nr:acyl--CoA ligase [Burkholderiales bacterium]